MTLFQFALQRDGETDKPRDGKSKTRVASFQFALQRDGETDWHRTRHQHTGGGFNSHFSETVKLTLKQEGFYGRMMEFQFALQRDGETDAEFNPAYGENTMFQFALQRDGETDPIIQTTRLTSDDAIGLHTPPETPS